MHHLARFQVARKKDMIIAAIRRVISIELVISLVLLAAFWVLADWLAVNYFRNPAAATLLRILSVSLVLMVIGDIPKFIFQGLQRMVLSASVNPTKMLFVLVIGAVLFQKDWGITAAAAAYLITYTLLPLLFAIPLRSVLTTAPSRAPGLTSSLLRFGIPITLSFTGYLIIEYTDVLLLTYFRSLTEVGLYNVAIPTSKLLFYFSGAFGTVIFPMVTELKTRKLDARLSAGMERAYTYALAALLPLSLAVFAFPDVLISTLFGPAYLGAQQALRILVLGSVAFALFTVNTNVFAGIGKPQITSKVFLIGGIGNILLCVILIPMFGITGAALATAVSYVALLALSARYTSRLAGIHLPWGKLARTATAGALLLATLLVGRAWVPLTPIPELIVCLLAGAGVYLGALLLMRVLTVQECTRLFRSAVREE